MTVGKETEPGVGGEWKSLLRITRHCELSAVRSPGLDLSFQDWAKMRSPASGVCSFCHVANLLDTSKVSVAFKTQKMRTQESHVGVARVLLALGVKGSGEHYGNGHGCAGWRSWLSQQSDCHARMRRPQFHRWVWGCTLVIPALGGRDKSLRLPGQSA